ncbi:MAG TPA: twin-arginine translocase TatA/TatE family subunit [Thermoanaerobaculia bacterium]|nr:twin-arginine translocase TatA/TatE family subunit [Thermoanaerobaculia bacterium]
MFGSLGVPELLLIFVVVLIVFGPRRIPEIGRTLGKALGEFRKATDDLKSSIEREVRLEELQKIAPAVTTPFESISRTEPVTYPYAVETETPAASPAETPAETPADTSVEPPAELAKAPRSE